MADQEEEVQYEEGAEEVYGDEEGAEYQEEEEQAEGADAGGEVCANLRHVCVPYDSRACALYASGYVPFSSWTHTSRG